MLHPGTSSPATKDVGSPGRRAVVSPRSDWRSWLIPVATFLGFAIPALSYLWMIHTYSVNVIFLDQWNDVALLGHAYSGTLHLSTLWAQHNENRIFFPNLIVLALAYTTHFNVVTEEYLSALMAFGATALVICAHKRRSPERRWIWYCPVAFLLLSLAQAGNTLWGFQMAWYLVLLMVALSLFLLDQEPQRWPVFACAIAAAMVASFSSLQGLLVWPAGLLLIYLRRRPGHLAFAWIASAAVAGVLYVVGYDFSASQSPIQNLRQNPTAVLTFFLQVLGDIVGSTHLGPLETAFGSVLAVTAIWALVRFTIGGRASTGGRPFALSFVLFGLLFSGLTASGRSGLFGAGSEYRYTVFTILVLVGLYLAVLDPPLAAELRSPEHGPPPQARSARRQRHVFSDPLFTLARVVVGVGIVLTVILGSANGIAQARVVHENRLSLGLVTVRANQYPDPVVSFFLYSGLESAQWLRRQITIARDHHLSLFATGDAARYLSERPLGPFVFPPPSAVWVLPRKGSTLHGKQYLDVVVSDAYDVTKVDYMISGPALEDATFATGFRTNYGWLGGWNTSKVPNGSYAIDATISDSGGRTVRTPPVEVRVENVNRPRS